MNNDTDITTVPRDTLEARCRLVWKSAESRSQADALEAGTHPLAALIPADAHAATIAGMRDEADRIDAQAAEANAELDRRVRAAKPFTGYVS